MTVAFPVMVQLLPFPTTIHVVVTIGLMWETIFVGSATDDNVVVKLQTFAFIVCFFMVLNVRLPHESGVCEFLNTHVSVLGFALLFQMLCKNAFISPSHVNKKYFQIEIVVFF